MKRTSLSRILCGCLVWIVFCGISSAEIGARAPQFSVRALDGKTYSNASLHGHVVLVQFWATQCPECRKSQTAVDNIARKYSGAGLMVLAVDVGDSENAVRKFLDVHPTSCPVALDADKKLSARFGRRGVPYYVLIDRDGFIAGTQSGAAGQDALVSLLSLAGLAGSSDIPHSAAVRSHASPEAQGDNPTQDSAAGVASDVTPGVTPSVTPPKVIDLQQDQPSQPSPGKSETPPASTESSNASPQGGNTKAASAPVVSPPKMIEIPQDQPSVSSSPAKPSPMTIFVLANGERLESDHYTMEGGVLHIMVGGERRAIPLSALDVKATTALNRERGIDLKIPQNGSEVSVSF